MLSSLECVAGRFQSQQTSSYEAPIIGDSEKTMLCRGRLVMRPGSSIEMFSHSSKQESKTHHEFACHRYRFE